MLELLTFWLAWSGVVAREPSPPIRLTIGERLEGVLAPGDDRVAGDALADTVSFESAAAQPVTVLVESLDADTRLAVLDDAGRTLAVDDQGGIGDNARVVLALDAGRSYRIRVEGASAAEVGAYELVVQPGEAATPGKKAKAELDLAYYARALERARARGAGGRRRAGWALARTNEIHWQVGAVSAGQRLAAAEEVLALARQTGDRSLEALALRQCAIAHRDSGRPREAVTVFEASRALYRQAGDAAGEIGVLQGLGMARVDLREYESAREILEDALVRCERTGDWRRARVLNGLGVVYANLGDNQTAVAYARRALAAAREVGDDIIVTYTLRNLGLEEARLNNYGRAIGHLEQSLSVARTIGFRYGEAGALDVLASIYGLLGQPEKAVRYAEESLATARALGERRDVSSVLNSLGTMLTRLGQHRRALERLQEALQILHDLDAPSVESATHLAMGDLYVKLGEWERARDSYEEGLGQAARARDELLRAEILERLAAVHLQRGDAAAAAALAEKTLAELRGADLGLPTTESNLRTTLARASASLGRRARAREEFEAALGLIEDVRTRVGENLNRAGYLDAVRRPFESYVAFLTEEGEPDAALAVAERGRARALLDLLVPGAAAVPAAGGSMAEGLREAPPPSLAQIKEQARRQRATFVEYFVTEERVFVWVVTPEGKVHPAVVPVSRSQLVDLVQQMRSSLSMDVAARDWEAPEVEDGDGADTRGPAPGADAPAPRPEEARRVLLRLHELLLRPVEARLPAVPGRVVTVIPDGPLYLVSFAALIDGRGRYLVERHTLSYAPSIGALVYMDGRRARTPAGRSRVLVVGNPSMPPLPGRKRRPAPLPGAEAEARAIERLYPASRVTTLTGRAAEERRVRDLAPGHSIVHLATHGYIRDDEPQESLLALAPSPEPGGEVGTDGDGLLTVREVAALNLHADLVILSGCNTGLGRVSGDGVIGLARAFLQAGAPEVVASLWRIADALAHPHMERFHRALGQQGKGSAAALRQAQLAALRDLRAKRYRTSSGAVIPELPTYWASFVVIGASPR